MSLLGDCVKTIDFPFGEINKTPATVRYAYDKCEKIELHETGDLAYINISDILTRIIHDCGRFSERFSSDCLCEIEAITTLCKCKYEVVQPIDEIITLGIREDGVDHNNFFMQHVFNSRRPMSDFIDVTPYYRRVLAVRVQVMVENGYAKAICDLKNLTHSFLRLNPADVDSDGRLILPAPNYPNGNPVPVDPYARANK